LVDLLEPDGEGIRVGPQGEAQHGQCLQGGELAPRGGGRVA